MFEFYQARRDGKFLLHLPDIIEKNRKKITHLSFMVWGEHCIECAAPACFQSCTLYEARPDGRCRRLEGGFGCHHACHGERGYGAEVLFRKWGKIEARGNTQLQPIEQLLRHERWADWLARFGFYLGQFLYFFWRDKRLRYLSYSLLERFNRRLHLNNPHPEQKPDAFLLEIYNPAAHSVRLTLTMTLAQAGHTPPFAAEILLPPGFSSHQFDWRLLVSSAGTGHPFHVALIPSGNIPPHLVIVMADFVRFEQTEVKEERGEKIKCLVWDLDHTLWSGVLLEEEAPPLRPGVLEFIERLDSRGILQSIASKNNYDHAWQRVCQLGLDHYFLLPQINWMPKSSNIRTLANRLNIGLDTFAFIDDNPFELEEVRQALPMVMGVNALELSSLWDHPRMQGSQSAEAQKRRQFYQDAFAREEVRTRFGDDYKGFLASCAIRLTVMPYGVDHFERVSELMQRTNQLNFSGSKYTLVSLPSILMEVGLDKHVLSCSDKFGSYGLVGFSLTRVRGEVVRVEEFMLSCRVQGKFIEQVFFDYLVRRYPGIKRLWVNFKRTARNQPAWQTLEALQFEADSAGGFYLDISGDGLRCDFIEVREE
ncbi:MAG: HAD-IIIC family phosphatase [Magnetococcus sp. DMHC-6]